MPKEHHDAHALRTWDEVAAEFNRRHPDQRPMTRSNAWDITNRAFQKLRRELRPLALELLDLQP